MNAVKKWWMMCLAVAVAVLAVGCGEDGGGEEADTGADACTLSDAECAGRGRVFNAAACRCDDQPGTIGDCAQVDALCDADLVQPEGFLCLRLRQPDAETGKTGACVQSCNSFFDDNCPVGQVCFPKGLFDAAKDICVPAGNLAEDRECPGVFDQTGGSPCQKGLMCLGGVCAAPDCSPLTTAKSCENPKEECSGVDFTLQSGGVIRTDVGFCFQPCEAFSSNNTCDPGQWCQPGTRKEGGRFPGSCTPGGGSKAPGAECVGTSECQDGSICLRVSQTRAECTQLCDATRISGSGLGGCGEKQGCAPLSSENERFDLGYCTESCGFDEGEGCSQTTDACYPSEIASVFEINFDVCINLPANDFYSNCTTGEFTFCNPTGLCMTEPVTGYDRNVCQKLCRLSEGALGSLDHKDCGGEPGESVCAGRFNTAVLPAGLCIPINCDPTEADSGACEVGEACRGVSSDNSKAGRCQQACNFDDPETSCGTGKQCYPGELLGFLGGNVNLTTDFCDNQRPTAATRWPLNPGEDCKGARMEAGDICGPFSICLQVDQAASGVRCFELCRTSEGAFNSTNHPDCNSASQVCAAIFQGVTSFGLCQGN
jgi:hypothetical protein